MHPQSEPDWCIYIYNAYIFFPGGPCPQAPLQLQPLGAEPPQRCDPRNAPAVHMDFFPIVLIQIHSELRENSLSKTTVSSQKIRKKEKKNTIASNFSKS